MHRSIPAVLLAVSTAAYGLLLRWRRSRQNHNSYPLPPGPAPLPIVGNVLGINPDEPWVAYTLWSKLYGDLVYSRLLNQEIIVINSEEVAKDLLERRSYNYSDRPAILRMANDFFGWQFSSIMIPYSNRWRLHRRLFHQAFRARAVPQYHPVQLQKARELVVDLLESPKNFIAHLQTHSASTIMSIVYGYDTAQWDDPIVNVVNRAIDLCVAAVRPEVAAFLGFFPFVRSIPAWFPGASFKQTALLSQKYAYEMVETPFRSAQQSLMAGATVPSMVSNSLNRVNGQDITEDDYIRAIKESSATAFAAANETTYSTILIFILAMLLNPDVQARAQAEIDSIVGSSRLPVFEDRPSLPYVEAVLRETLRWHPTAPLGVPHAASTADVYNGYFIPQGATIIVNTWAITRNEAKYPNPEEFRPERFFNENGELNNDTMNYAFGAGRRICVGRHIADASVWSAVIYILAIFKIVPCKDEHGNDIQVIPKWTAGVTSHPHTFPCQFVPRIPGGLSAEQFAQIY